MTEAQFNAAMARENANLTPAKVADGDWKLEVLSAGAVSVTSQNGNPSLVIPIGADLPMRCILGAKDADLMSAVTAGLNSIETESHGGLRKVLPSAIAVAQEAPVMFVSAVYSAGSQVSLFKFAVHAHGAHPVLCMHDGLGFWRTFQAASTRLFETLERGQPAAPPQLVELFRISIDGFDWGFSRVTVDRGTETSWVEDTDTTLLVPESATKFASQTDSSEELIDKTGRLVRGIWAKADGKTLLHKVQLAARDKKGTYDYQGEVGGKPIKGELRSKDARAGIASSLASTLRLRSVAAKPAALEIKQEEYDPGAAPQKLIETRYVRAKGDPGGQVRVITPERELGAIVDPDGRIRDLTFKAANATIHLERIYTRGKL